METPFYILYKSPKRVYFPKMFMMIGLSIVFFFGIWLNLIILDVSEQTKSITLAASAILLAILTAAETYSSYKKSKEGYKFYQNRIEFMRETAYFGNVENVSLEKNLFDRLLNTATIVLHPNFRMKAVRNSGYMLNYMQQLIQRAKQVYY